jgi:hypothetical protein
VVREVVVVLDGLQGGRFAEEAEVVDGNRGWEEGLDCCGGEREFGARGGMAYLRSFLGRSGGCGRERWFQGEW